MDELAYYSPHATSQPFKCIVGDHDFSIHQGYLAKLPQPLRHTIETQIRNNQNIVTVFKDVDKPTFTRLCQWLHTDNYNGQEPSHGLTLSPETTRAIADLPKSERESLQAKHASPVEDAGTDHTQTFYAHVEVWQFAVAFHLEPLKQVAVDKVKALLWECADSETSASDVLAFLREVYEQPLRKTDQMDELRRVVMEHAEILKTLLQKEGDFRELLLDVKRGLDALLDGVRGWP